MVGGRGRVVPLAGLPGGIEPGGLVGVFGGGQPVCVLVEAPRRCAARWTGSRPASDASVGMSRSPSTNAGAHRFAQVSRCRWASRTRLRCMPRGPGPVGEDAGGLVGAGQLGVPGAAQPGGVLLSARGEGGGAAGGRLLGLLGGDPGGVTVGLEWTQDLLAMDRPGGLLLNTAQPLPQVLQLAVGDQLFGPGLAQLVQHVGELGGGVRPRGRSVSGRRAGRRVSCGGRSQVGPLPAERGDPLLACVVKVLGDQVRDVGLAAAGHRHVGRGGGGRVRHHEVGGLGGVALGAVAGGGVTELDVLADVVGGQLATAPVAVVDGEPAVAVHPGDGPGLPVGHAEGGVVAAGHDQVPGADPLPVPVADGAVVVDDAGGDEPVADRGVQRGGVLARVDHHRGVTPGRRAAATRGRRAPPAAPPRWRAAGSGRGRAARRTPRRDPPRRASPG